MIRVLSRSEELQLKKLRNEIDRADQQLLMALSVRFQAVAKLGQLKKEFGLPVVQKSRWAEVLEDRLGRGKKLGLREQFLIRVLNMIQKEAIWLQNTNDTNDSNNTKESAIRRKREEVVRK